ncbi:G2 mitotic-specific cyclin-B2 [Brachionus plicatilis]|uniref:G2 mitotic-specific cyclin-B2 n=1 Tax=Brachionus plicatilis TaxID=10195 RepID=A0A3M7SR00_BRAPC|nr:G2 mitotic-specific cyclin-B2 [Brachionus plicatilis]
MNDNRYAVSSHHAAPLTQANCLFKRQTYKNLLGGANRDENIVLKSSSLVKLQSHTITSQSYSNQVSTACQASIRNALGDIGNRIRLGLPPANKELAKPAELAQETVSNNSCIMLEEEEDNEVEEIELDEESMHENIIDIDECDAENSQLVADYVKDIYKYLTQTEKKFRIRPNFLEAKIVSVKMRSVLVDWLIQVHLKFHLLQETLYLCVQIIDAYLQVENVPKMQLQLVGVTALFLASKYEEMYVPAIEDFVYMTDNTYTKSEIRQMEISILKSMNFMFSKPLPLTFLRRFSKAGQASFFFIFFFLLLG